MALKKELPPGLWMRCLSEECGKTIFKEKVEANFYVCPECGYHFRLTAYQRVQYLLDEGSFEELYKDLEPQDPLKFHGLKSYSEKIKASQEKTQIKDACVIGNGKIEKNPVVFAVTDPNFIMGSMGVVVGEKLALAAEKASELKLPLIICSGSGGGARMEEGALSLMQMAKTCAALSKYSEEGGFYIGILTDSTMGGAMASFASVGDIIIAEPKALLGFTGPRVIQQTIRKTLPPGFQTSEFLLEHGMIDMIIQRKLLRQTLTSLLTYWKAGKHQGLSTSRLSRS